MAKFDKQSLCQKIFFFGMTLLHAHAHYNCIVCSEYQISSSMHYLRTSITPTGKNGKGRKANILSKTNILASNFFTQMFNVSILCKQSIRLFQQKL